MNCSSCGTAIAPGVAYCPSCGMPTPYYTSSPGSTPYSPTVAASPYGGGAAGGSQLPPTEYGSPGAYPGAQPQDPYQSYSAPPQNPYGASANAQVPPAYNYNNQSAYPAQGYTPGIQPGMYSVASPPKRRSNVGIILAVIGAIVVLACVGSIIAVTAFSRTPDSTTTTGATVTTTTQSTSNTGSPSGQPISPDAAAIITNALTSSSIDSNYAPTGLTSKFSPGQKVYVTFDIDSKGQRGCSIAKWYDNNQLVDTSPLKHSPENQVAYFALSYDAPTQGAVELYWTPNIDCTGGQLAQVVKFTVGTQSSTGAPIARGTAPFAAIVREWL